MGTISTIVAMPLSEVIVVVGIFNQREICILNMLDTQFKLKLIHFLIKVLFECFPLSVITLAKSDMQPIATL